MINHTVTSGHIEKFWWVFSPIIQILPHLNEKTNHPELEVLLIKDSIRCVVLFYCKK